MPSKSANAASEIKTGAVRLRTSWLGFAIAEELIEDCFGSRFWRRVRFSILISPERNDDRAGGTRDLNSLVNQS